MESDTIKQVQRKNKIEKKKISGELENDSRQNSLAKTTSKEINTWAVTLVRYSRPFLKWNRDELKQIDQRIRKLMTMHKTLHPRGDVDRLYVSRKREEEDFQALKSALTHRYNYSNKNGKKTTLWVF